jgi:hypothetical protein
MSRPVRTNLGLDRIRLNHAHCQPPAHRAPGRRRLRHRCKVGRWVHTAKSWPIAEEIRCATRVLPSNASSGGCRRGDARGGARGAVGGRPRVARHCRAGARVRGGAAKLCIYLRRRGVIGAPHTCWFTWEWEGDPFDRAVNLWRSSRSHGHQHPGSLDIIMLLQHISS